MTLPVDPLPLGAPFAIGDAVFAALVSAFPAPTVVLNNPERAAAVQDGERIVFVEDVGDDRVAEPGGQQKREYRFNLAVINRTHDARRGAHGDYRQAKRVVRDALASLKLSLQVATGLREGAVTYRLENVDVGGSLVLGTFSIQYRDPG